MRNPFLLPSDSTPLDDVSGLKLKWVSHLDDLNRVEAENIAHAKKILFAKSSLRKYKSLTIEQLKTIHRIMFSNVWEWAGKFRTTMKSIGSRPYLIQMQLAELCQEIDFWAHSPVDLTLLERAARIHHKLVYIHPFENGNGRFSRLVSDLYLLAWNGRHPVWPSNLHTPSNTRPEYIISLKAADKGDFAPLLRLMITFGAKEPKPSERGRVSL